MFDPSNLHKLSFFVQLSTQIQTHCIYFVKILAWIRQKYFIWAPFVTNSKDLHTYHLVTIIDHMDAPKSIQFTGVSNCMAGGGDLILDLVTINHQCHQWVFPFEFLGGTNTCGNRNAQESHVCVVHQDDTHLSTGSGLEWLWIERDGLWIKLTSITFCIIVEPLLSNLPKRWHFLSLYSGHQSSILIMISKCAKQPQWQIEGEHNWQFLQCLGWWFTRPGRFAINMNDTFKRHPFTMSQHDHRHWLVMLEDHELHCNSELMKPRIWAADTTGEGWLNHFDKAGGNDRGVWKALATLSPL